jgi:hypothetical protein
MKNVKILGLIFFLCLVLSFNASATLISHWTFNQNEGSNLTIKDVVSGWDCVINNNVYFQAGGKFGNYANFTQNSFSVCNNTNKALSLGNYSESTVCLWVMKDTQHGYFLSQQDTYGISSSGAAWNAQYRENLVENISTTNIDDGVWHHICILVNDSVMITYLDNIAAGMTAHSAPKYNNGNGVYLGSLNGNNGVEPKNLDDMYLFDAMLTPAEIDALYDSESTSSTTTTTTTEESSSTTTTTEESSSTSSEETTSTISTMPSTTTTLAGEPLGGFDSWDGILNTIAWTGLIVLGIVGIILLIIPLLILLKVIEYLGGFMEKIETMIDRYI